MTTKEDIFDETIRVLTQELRVDQTLTGDTSMESLGLESLELMQVFVYLEERFGFEFPVDATTESVATLSLASFAEFVQRASGKPEPGSNSC